MTDQEEYDLAMREALARELFFGSTGPYLTPEFESQPNAHLHHAFGTIKT